MKLGAFSSAVVSTLLLAALAYSGTAPTSNKWRIELDGQARSTGELQFRVTPRQGESIDVVANIRSGPGLRAITMGSQAGLRLAFDFGKPEA